jgi:hypothetical protein
MADNSGISRIYHLSDGEMALFANTIGSAMTRDLIQFESYSVTNTKIEDFIYIIDNFQALPDDDLLRGDVSYAVEQKDSCRNTVLSTMRSISVRAKSVFGENSAKYRSLAPNSITKMTDSVLLVAARNVHTQAVNNAAELAVEGVTTLYLTSFNTANQAFEDALDEVGNRKFMRDHGVETKILKGNELYTLLVKYCDYGKTIWDGVSPAKYNDYVIYTPGPGSITAPVGLNYNAATKVISWSIVENATSYQVQISSDNENFSEIYAGAANSFVYSTPIANLVYIQCRARNANGYGKWSEVVEVV